MGSGVWEKWAAAAMVTVVVVVVWVPGVASADPMVQFSTGGGFDLGTLAGKSGVSASVYNAPGTIAGINVTLGEGDAALGVGDPTLGVNTFLVFHHAPANNPIDLGAAQYYTPQGFQVAPVTFGYFTLHSTDPNGANSREKYREFGGASFTLDVTQYLPIAGEGEFASKLIHGTVWYDESSTGTGSFLSVKFGEPLSFTVPSNGDSPNAVKYTIQQTVYMNNSDGQTNPDGSPRQYSINGTVSSTVAAPLPGVAAVGLTLIGGAALRRFRRPPVA